jgi:outer membrane protein TolC
LKKNNVEQQIEADVRNKVHLIETDRMQVETYKTSTMYAKEQLFGEQKRFEGGLSENYRVQQVETDYSQAQNRELQAKISYKKSVIALEQATFMLLDSNDFTIIKTGK